MLKVNGEAIALADGPLQRADKSFSWEIEGKETAELILAELDETDPAGRFRLLVEGNQLLFQRATLKDWGAAETLITMDSKGVILDPGLDEMEHYLGVLLNEVVGLRSLLELLTGIEVSAGLEEIAL